MKRNIPLAWLLATIQRADTRITETLRYYGDVYDHVLRVAVHSNLTGKNFCLHDICLYQCKMNETMKI